MSRATPTMRGFARRLIAYETRDHKPAKPMATFPVCEKLRPHLVTLVGNAGYHALLLRALALASAEIPWLHAVRAKADGTLETLDTAADCPAPVSPKEIVHGRIVLLAQLLGLLVAFIGGNLTLQLVGEIWPKVVLDDLDFGNGGKNEKAK